MRLASYILASFNRPLLLRECVQQLKRTEVPFGWELEIVVCCPIEQRLPKLDVWWTSARSTDIGSQLTGAFRAARGELILVTGDDDFQHPKRLLEAVCAAEDGHPMSGLRTFQFFNRRNGAYCNWQGDVRRAGGLRNYHRDVLDRCNGWPEGNKNIDHLLDMEMSATGIPLDVHPLPDYLGEMTVGTDGTDNACAGRPFPPPGETIRAGAYAITGLNTAEYQKLPEHLREALERCRE